MNSFSQGIFLFKNGLHGKSEKRKKSSKMPIPQTIIDFGPNERLWNEEFDRTWGFIKRKVDEIQVNNNDGHLAELCDFFREANKANNSTTNDATNMSFLHIAALLTGINKPDHFQYFRLLSNTLSKKRVALTVFLPARDCPNIRTAIESLVSCILSNGRKHNYRNEEDTAETKTTNLNIDDSGDSENEMNVSHENDDEPPIKLRRNQYTLDVLQSWYNFKFAGESSETKPQIAIIMPNFEEFKPNVLKDLILILSNHCKRLPFVLILGVATSSTTLLNTLSFTETTRIKLRVFSGQPPNQILDQIMDSIILRPICPFQVTSNVLEYLKSVFVYYDLTTKNFLKSLKYCLLDQYSRGNAYSVCSTSFEQAKKNILKLNHEDFETIRRLMSFRPYVEAISDPRNIIAIFKDDEYLRKQLTILVRNIYVYLYKFYGYIRLVWMLVKDLPKAPLGKRLSDIYMYCHASQKSVTETEEFEKCWQLLDLMSKEEIVILLDRAKNILEEYEDTNCSDTDTTIDKDILLSVHDAFDATHEGMQSLINEIKQERSAEQQILTASNQQMFQSRTEFYNNYKQQKQANAMKSDAKRKLLDFLRVEVIDKHLLSRSNAPPLLELFVYSDYDQIRSHLRGTSRSAIHKVLTDPNSYLQCKCCALDNQGQLLRSMPDNSIAYGLLLESGQQVNIYDWMRAFNTIVGDRNADDDDDDENIAPKIQAKFTRARAELHFMGFTKTSKRKTDHVTRTTW